MIIATFTIIIEPKIIHNFMNVIHIEDVVVKNDFRGKKIGNRILNFCCNFAKQNYDQNSKIFYEKNGFTCKNIEMLKYF